MRFGCTARAKKSILATEVTSASSLRSGMPFIRHGGHPLSRTVYGTMSLCTFVVVALMVLLLTGRDLGTIHGPSFVFQICMTAARKRCHYPALCHPSLITIMMMSYEAGSMAGDCSKRSGGRPQRSMMFAAQFCDLNPQFWQQMMHNCRSGCDLAQL